MTTTLTEGTFEQAVRDHEIVFVDFWADWCGPCRIFAPIYEGVAAKHPDIVFGKVDTEAEEALSQAFEIRSIPTLMIFRDGIPLFQQAGTLPAPALEDLVRQVRALDMDEVRRKIASSEKGA
jgi:thioredoxin 1